MASTIKIADITLDHELQPRVEINHAVVDEYTEAMQRGKSFPPVVVFNDGTTNWLADGYHRYKAAQKAGLENISAEFRTGTKTDALKFALSANATHGLRRSQSDRRRAVIIALREFGELSDREIGRMVKVDGKTVAKYRQRVLKVNSVKAGLANGESFEGLNSKKDMLFIVKMPHEPRFGANQYAKYAYYEFESPLYKANTRGVNITSIDLAVYAITDQKYVMEDFDWFEDETPDKTLSTLIEVKEVD